MLFSWVLWRAAFTFLDRKFSLPCTHCTLEFLGLFEFTFSAKNMFSSQMLSSSRGKAFNFTFTFHIVKAGRLEFSTFLNSLLYFLDPVRPPSAPPWLLFAIQGVHQQAPGNSSAVGMGSWMPKCLEPSGRNTTPALRCPPRLFRTSASQADSYLPGQERARALCELSLGCAGAKKSWMASQCRCGSFWISSPSPKILNKTALYALLIFLEQKRAMKKANHSNAENHNKAAAHAKSWMAYITVIEANEYQDSTKTGRIKQELHQELMYPWGFDINIFALIQRNKEANHQEHQEYGPKARGPFRNPKTAHFALFTSSRIRCFSSLCSLCTEASSFSMKFWASVPKFSNPPDDRQSCLPANSLQMLRMLGSSRKLTSRGIPSNFMLLPGYRTLRHFEEFTSRRPELINDLDAAVEVNSSTVEVSCIQVRSLFRILGQLHRYFHQLLQLHRLLHLHRLL